MVSFLQKIKWKIEHVMCVTIPRLSYVLFHGCENCGSLIGVKWESSRTAYHYEGIEGIDADPNRPRRYCRSCADMHHDYWDGMWAEYYNSRGC